MSLFARVLGRRIRWEAQWHTFPGFIHEKPASWLVDIGAVDAAPVERLPIRLDVEVGYRASDAGGLPVSAAAQDGLHSVGQAVAGFAAAAGGALVGRVASAGRCRFTAQLPAEPDAAPGLPVPDATVGTQYDPLWAYVRDTLAPDERQLHVLGDLMLVNTLAGSGDGLAAPRPVSLVGVFPAPAGAQAAAAELARQGFAVTVEPDDEGDYALTALRTAAISPPEVHDLTWSVKEYMERHGGAYGGWHCPVTA